MKTDVDLWAKIKNMLAGEAGDGDENQPSRALELIGHICEYNYSFVGKIQEQFCR